MSARHSRADVTDTLLIAGWGGGYWGHVVCSGITRFRRLCTVNADTTQTKHSNYSHTLTQLLAHTLSITRSHSLNYSLPPSQVRDSHSLNHSTTPPITHARMHSLPTPSPPAGLGSTLRPERQQDGTMAGLRSVVSRAFMTRIR